LAAGRSLAPALLFYGCHSAEDNLYPEAFERWQQLGAVSLLPAFSHTPEKSQGCRYVQDRVYHDKAEVIRHFEAGARLAVCVPGHVSDGVRQTLIDIAKERLTEVQGKGVEDAVAEEWLEGAWHAWDHYPDV
jgi:cytochrome P450/NADPH-cytochrome P450 reductase